MTLDSEHERSVKMVKAPTRNAVVVVNHSLAEKMGELELELGYEVLSKENQGLVFSNKFRYGTSGRKRKRIGYDAVVVAEVVGVHITGVTGVPSSKPSFAIADMVQSCTSMG